MSYLWPRIQRLLAKVVQAPPGTSPSNPVPSEPQSARPVDAAPDGAARSIPGDGTENSIERSGARRAPCPAARDGRPAR
ncbi:MAG: hypothetical protein QOD63_2051, partial [Actinomycetota bacterium]|nr:hypothetical protein [Actinomycetota bacterium]